MGKRNTWSTINNIKLKRKIIYNSLRSFRFCRSFEKRSCNSKLEKLSSSRGFTAPPLDIQQQNRQLRRLKIILLTREFRHFDWREGSIKKERKTKLCKSKMTTEVILKLWGTSRFLASYNFIKKRNRNNNFCSVNVGYNYF